MIQKEENTLLQKQGLESRAEADEPPRLSDAHGGDMGSRARFRQ